MHEIPPKNKFDITKILLLAGAFVFLYWAVLEKLGRDWWSDENYSHGLLVPFVIGLLVWRDWDGLKASVRSGALWLGGGICVVAMLMLVAGLLGAELFTTRVSMAIMLAGTVVYLFGARILRLLAVPFALLLLAIPIPQIIFNKISFPLQLWASKTAVWGIRLFGVPTVRKGNVFDILPAGSSEIISLEVVGACSGIRSLMTLVTLALVLGYFSSNSRGSGFVNFRSRDLWRTVCLMLMAVPIAVLTNAARVTGTGVLTYHFGRQATDGIWHDLSGWLVYLVSLALLFGANYLLRRLFKDAPPNDELPGIAEPVHNRTRFLPIIAFMILGGVAVTWIVNRGEADIQRRPLTELPSSLGNWQQTGTEVKFDQETEKVLGASDYTMREYAGPDGRSANVYIGYYLSQRTGATYHSPQNCLPGAGWVMKDPQYVEITKADGGRFTANQYIVENGPYRTIMIYWYQGRGRTEASEYLDKINTVWDSVTRRRSDGAFIRVMTNVNGDEAETAKAAAELSARLAENITPFVPE